MLNLNEYVTSLGIDLGGLNLALVLSISGDGTTIGGVGIPMGGFFPSEGYVLTIPEPSSLALLTMLGLAAAALRRR